MALTQTDLVYGYMLEYGGITPIEAMRDIGCMRLAARISDLKRQGVKIKTEYARTKSSRTGRWVRYAVYSIEQ